MTTITVPKRIAGDLIAIPRSEYEGYLQFSKFIDKDQLWFWTKEWQKKEREADEDIKNGRISGPFYSSKELLKSLKSKIKNICP